MGGVWVLVRGFGLRFARRRNRLVLGWFAGVKALLAGSRYRFYALQGKPDGIYKAKKTP